MQVEPSRTELAINNPRVHSRDAIDEAVSGQPLEFRGRRETFKIGDRGRRARRELSGPAELEQLHVKSCTHRGRLKAGGPGNEVT